MSIDYLGEDGCCLICIERGECETPCYECKCTKCEWYCKVYYDIGSDYPPAREGKCGYLEFKWEMVRYDAKIIRETEKAVLLRCEGFKDAWFPKSQIDITSNGIYIPNWLAEEKGWVLDDDWFELDGMKIKEFEELRLYGKEFIPNRW